jgi:hypothetical protein
MAAFQWPISKLELVNSALAQTGNNLVNLADDGSVEWGVCSPAYERALAVVTEAHPWSWVTEFRTLQPSPTPPEDGAYDTAYDFPDNLVHLILARLDGRPCTWNLLNGQIVVNRRGNSTALTVKGIFSTNSDPVNSTPTVVIALERFVMSGIYRGIHKDNTEAGRMFGEANAILAAAKARHDMQKPKRAVFISRLRRARSIRRPDFPIPSGGDSGSWG